MDKFFDFVPNAYPDKPSPPKLSIKQLAPDRFEFSLGAESLQFNEHIAKLLANFFLDALSGKPALTIVRKGD